MSRSSLPRAAGLALMLASGFAGLGYQMVWTQQCALWLGAESAAVLAVVTAFFGGLAAGALLLGPRIERSAAPWRWYVACEAVIGLWALVLLGLMQPAGDVAQGWIGVEPAPGWQWGVTFLATVLLLLPATAAMGATLPAMERLLVAFASSPRDAAAVGSAAAPRSVAALYAANTLGAVGGVLAVTFWLVPAWGLSVTAAGCALLNALCALGGAAWLRRPGAISAAATEGRADGTTDAATPHQPAAALSAAPGAIGRADRQASPRAVQVRLALSGLLGIGFEVVVVRVLSQLNEDTVYTFALLLAVYLVGTALGAAAYQRWLLRQEAQRWTERLPALLSLACLAGTASLWAAPLLRAGAQAALGDGMGSALSAEALLAMAAFGLPTLVMGALFSHLCTQAQAQGMSLGRAVGINTLGAALAAPVFGVLLAPTLGPKATLLILSAAYLVLSGLPALRQPWAWGPAMGAAALGLVAAPLAFVDVPTGGHVVSYAEGPMAAVSVTEDEQGVARLRINNRQQEGSSASLFVDGRQALIPLLLHPSPHRALFLGLGTGVTAATAAQDPALTVEAVELLPEVIEASPTFTRALGLDASALHLRAADARRYVRAASARYDVIVSDNFHPARSGSGALYTREHFAAVRARLAEGGLFCQWLPLHQLDLASLRSVVKAFLDVYPDGAAVLASNSLETPVLGLVGHGPAAHKAAGTAPAAGGLALAQVRERLAGATGWRGERGPEDFGFEDEMAVLGTYVAGPKALAAFAGDVPMNTDDRPVVAYAAPRLVYAPTEAPRDRLLLLLATLSVDPDDLLPGAAPAESHRLAAYWSARNRFIEAGRSVRPVADARAMLDQVGGPLLDVVRLSPDFRPAYDPLLRMAMAVSQRGDVATGRAVLTELTRLQPARPEAGQALLMLAGS